MKSEWLIKLCLSLENAMPTGCNIARTLADDLNISNESAYRRLNGRTAFLPEELLKLRKRYGISLDALAEDAQTVSMRLAPLFTSDSNIKSYLKNVLDDLRFFTSGEETNMYCLAADIPFFRLMGQKHLAAFKLFYWQKSILRIQEFEMKRFDTNAINEETLEMCGQLSQIYQTINSTEIWNEQTINGTLRQLEYYSDCSFFNSPESLFLVYQDLLGLINKVQAEARSGVKSNDANLLECSYSLWNCELIIDNNSVLLLNESTGKDVLAIGFNSFNSIRTLHPFIISEYREWLDALLSKSTHLSGQSDRYRIEFVRKMTDRIYESAYTRLPNSLREQLKLEQETVTT